MTRAVRQFLVGVVFSSLVGVSPAQADDARLPVPPQDKVEQSLGLIRDAYEADYQAAKESGEPEQLMAQLRASAVEEADPVTKYALLVEAENVAAAHDNYCKAVELLDTRVELFRIDGLALKGDLLKRLAGPKVTADLELCDQAMDTAREAMRYERFSVASDAASLAVSIAKAIDREQKAAARKQRRNDGRNVVKPAPIGVELVKKAAALQTQVTETEKSFNQYEAALEKVKTTPDDPAVNAVIGSYICFVRGDWKAGLSALAKSDLPEFASLAATEMKLEASSGPLDPQQAFALAGKWWSAAESKGLSDEREAAIKDHAAGFYAVIVDQLEGALEKKLAGSRLRGFKPHAPVDRQLEAQADLTEARNPGPETPIAEFTYEFHQNEAVITGYRGKETTVVIPATILGKPVCGLGGPFKDRNDLVSVSIPNTVRSIGPMAFFGCNKLESIVLPPKLESIGFNAFEGCSNLKKEVRIPATTTKIDFGAFIRCPQITNIIVDKDNPSYTTVDGVLYDKAVTELLTCPGAKKGVLRVPATVEKIEGWAFAGCRQLERIIIPATTNAIHDNAFVECDAPHEIIKYPYENKTTQDQQAFEGVRDLLRGLDMKRQSIHGNWVFDRGLMSDGKTGQARFRLSENTPASLKLQVSFQRELGGDALSIMFPVGRQHVALMIRPDVAGLDTVGLGRFHGNATTTYRAFVDPRNPDVLHEVEILVKSPPNERQASVEVRYDGDAVIQWSGDPAVLAISPDWDNPPVSGIEVGSFHTRFTIKSFLVSSLK